MNMKPEYTVDTKCQCVLKDGQFDSFYHRVNKLILDHIVYYGVNGSATFESIDDMLIYLNSDRNTLS